MADKFKVQDGIEFADGTSMTTAAVGGGASGPTTVQISATPPTTPVIGQVYYDSDDGNIYICTDPTGTPTWVDSSPSSSTGNFSFSANTVETNSGTADVVISINGPDGAPTPAFITRKWSFGTNGSINFVDPFLNTVDASITTTKVGNWDTAYGWGDHSGAGYLTAVPDDSFEAKTTATGVVVHDCTTNKVFVHSSISANFTANLTNLNLAAGKATNITLILNQGATAYICNALQIGGAAQTINWQGSSSAPTGNSNKKDVMSFSILNVAGTYTVLGQLVSFG
jgi:hypothetical protein